MADMHGRLKSIEAASISAANVEVLDLISELPRLWWMFSIRGMLTITFSGICFFLSSSMSTLLLRPAGFVLLQVLFSFYVMVTGFILLTGALYAFDAKLHHRKVLLADAIVNTAIGVVFFVTSDYPHALDPGAVCIALDRRGIVLPGGVYTHETAGAQPLSSNARGRGFRFRQECALS